MTLENILKEEVKLILKYLENWDEISTENNVTHISLLAGLPSIILILIDFNNKFPSKERKDIIIRYIKKTFEIVEKQETVLPSYCAGLAGYGFFLMKIEKSKLLNNIKDIEVLEQINEILIEIDEILEEQIDIDFSDDNYDILHGVLGVGLYFLERNKLDLVDKIIDSLQITCFKQGDEVFWKKYDKYTTHTSVIDMGTAHGNTSILYFLSKVLSYKSSDDRVIELIKGSLNFYLKNHQELNEQIYSYYPHLIIASEFVDKSNKPENSRLAWCYGDLGILHTLLIASSQIQDNVITKNIIEKLKTVIERKNKKDNFEINSGFCHGSSGISVMYHNIYLLTGIDIFLQESKYWVNETLKFKKINKNVLTKTGYDFPVQNSNEQILTMLEGLSGILFCYLKFLYNEMPLTEETLFIKF